MSRVTWFVAGAAAGATGATYAARKVRRTVRQTAAQLAPANVANRAVSRVRQRRTDVVAAIRDGRLAMRAKEDELKAWRDKRVEPVDRRLQPGERLLFDGEPVESGRVIVLKQKR